MQPPEPTADADAQVEMDDLAEPVPVEPAATMADLGVPVARLIVTVALSALAFIYADDLTQTITRLLAVAIAVATTGRFLYLFFRRRDGSTRPSLRSSIGTAFVVIVALSVAAFPTGSLPTVLNVAGGTALVVGALERLTRSRSTPNITGVAGNGTALMILGIVLIAAPLAAPYAAVWVVAAGLCALATIRVISAAQGTVVQGEKSAQVWRQWIARQEQPADERQRVTDAVIADGPERWTTVGRFAILMFLASVISAMGVITDSTAVVIGAMLVAPLITPLMGTSFALVMGWPRRMGRSAAQSIGGVTIAVATGWFFAALPSVTVDLLANSQITSRSSPTMLDLVIAIAAGATGAYAISRPDVSSSLPGVAVAIALVPPLTVIGVALEEGDLAQAAGTLLLFTTNAVAILITGGIVFLLTGVVPVRRMAERQRRVSTAAAAVLALAALVVGALSLNGEDVARDALARDRAQTSVKRWLEDDTRARDVVTEKIAVDGDEVTVVVSGPGRPPDAAPLAQDLAEELGRVVTLDLQWIPRERQVLTSGEPKP